MNAFEFIAPVRIESPNRTRDHHWSKRKRKTDEQRSAVYLAYRCSLRPSGSMFCLKPFANVRLLLITLTRIAPRLIDSDNNVAGFKAVRDIVAELVNADDGDPEIAFVYDQQSGKPREYSVRIRIEHGITVKES